MKGDRREGQRLPQIGDGDQAVIPHPDTGDGARGRGRRRARITSVDGAIRGHAPASDAGSPPRSAVGDRHQQALIAIHLRHDGVVGHAVVEPAVVDRAAEPLGLGEDVAHVDVVAAVAITSGSSESCHPSVPVPGRAGNNHGQSAHRSPARARLIPEPPSDVSRRTARARAAGRRGTPRRPRNARTCNLPRGSAP